MNRSTAICDLKEQLLVALEELEKLKNIFLSKNELAIIIAEETIIMDWTTLKKVPSQMNFLISKVKETVFWNIPDMKNLIQFLETSFSRKMSPCKFVSFLKDLFNRETIDKEFTFLKWVLEDESRCQRTFRNIKYRND